MLDPASIQCRITLPNLGGLFNYVCKKHYPTIPKDQVPLIAKEHLKKQIRSFDTNFDRNKFQKYCPAATYSLSAYVFLSTQFREFVTLGTIYKQEDKKFKEIHQTFIENLMLFRYDPSQELREKLRRNVFEINEHLADIAQISRSSKERIKQIVSVFYSLLDFPDLLELPISLLIKRSTFKDNADYSTSILDAYKTYTNIFNEVAINLSTTIKIVEEKLNKYQNTSFPKSEFLRELTDLFNKFKIRYLPLFITLHEKNFNNFNKINLNKLVNFTMAWDRFVNNNELYNRHALDEEIGEVVSRNEDEDFFGGNQGIYFSECPSIIKSFEEKGKGLSENTPELAENKLMIDFYKDMNFCHAILDGFISNYLPILITTTIGVYTACEKLDVDQKNSLTSQIYPKKETAAQVEVTPTCKPEPLPLTDERDIDQLVSSIKGPSTQKTSKSGKKGQSLTRTRKSNQRTRSTDRKKPIESHSTPIPTPTQSKKTSTVTSASHPLSEPEKIYQHSNKLTELLTKLCKETKPLLIKGCLRQANMYLIDLVTADKRLSDSNLSDNVKRFYIMAFLQSAYYCLEALLHHEKGKDEPSAYTIKGNGHNLTKLFNQTHIKVENESIISNLFLVNYWVRAPLQQSQVWERFGNITILNDIKKIYETKNLSSLSNTIHKIKSYLPQINQLIESLPSLKEGATKSFSATPVCQSFILDHDFSKILNSCQILSGTFESLLTKLPVVLHPQFSQAIAHLQLIEGIFTELQEKSLSPELFSLLVRHLIFWENTLLEDFLKVLYHLKTGVAGNRHNLTQLFKGINWTTTPRVPVNTLFLNDDFGNMHNISRYPFTTLKRNASLYPLIIKSELLREHPELGEEQPFELAKKKNEGEKTPLNYIEMHTEGLTPQMIIQNLKETTHKIFNLINELMLPELRTSLD